MLVKVTRISVINCEETYDELEKVAELKKELADRLKVRTSDIHFTITEIE